MDLATGAKDVFVMMTLLTREGASKIVEACTYPLTGVGCVTRVYTDKAVFLTGPDGVTVRETFGCTLTIDGAALLSWTGWLSGGARDRFRK